MDIRWTTNICGLESTGLNFLMLFQSQIDSHLPEKIPLVARPGFLEQTWCLPWLDDCWSCLLEISGLLSLRDYCTIHHQNRQYLPLSVELLTSKSTSLFHEKPSSDGKQREQETIHKEELTEQRSLYKLRLNRYNQRKASLANLHRFIQETVHPDRVHHTFNCDTVH